MNNEILSMVSNSLTKYVFTQPNQSEMINIIFGGTSHFDSLREEIESEPYAYIPLKWAMTSDDDLTRFVYIMFYKKATQNTEVSIKNQWIQYENTPDYFAQVVNYMLNSDDYLLGDRFVFGNEESRSQFRQARTQDNMREEFMVRHQDPFVKQQYYARVLSIGDSMYRLANE